MGGKVPCVRWWVRSGRGQLGENGRPALDEAPVAKKCPMIWSVPWAIMQWFVRELFIQSGSSSGIF